MNEEVQQKLIEYLESLESTAKSASDFVITEAPIVAQELVAWTFWENTIWAVICVAAIATIGIIAKVLWGFAGSFEKEIDQTGARVMTVALSIIVSVILFAEAIIKSLAAIKACVAPRLIIIEEVTKLIQ